MTELIVQSLARSCDTTIYEAADKAVAPSQIPRGR
jgi:hypothetical protein